MASAGQGGRPCLRRVTAKVQLQPPTAPLTGDVGFPPEPAAFSRSSPSPPKAYLFRWVANYVIGCWGLGGGLVSRVAN